MSESFVFPNLLERNILYLLFQSRVLVVFLGIALNPLLPDHDAEAFKGVLLRAESPVDKLIVNTLGPMMRWDSLHFLSVARFGYVLETDVVFAPLFPFLCRWAAMGLEPFGIGLDAGLLLASLTINGLAFTLAGLLLYRFVLQMTGGSRTPILDKSKWLAVTSCFLFAVNPASVFFTVAYSESLFFLLTMAGLLILFRPDKQRYHRCVELFLSCLLSSMVMSLALLTRSNGALNCTPIAWLLGARLILHFYAFLRKADTRLRICDCATDFQSCIGCAYVALTCAVVFLLPFMVYQRGFYSIFCNSPPGTPLSDEMMQLSRHVPDVATRGEVEKLEWCNHSHNSYLAIPYTAIQAKHWDVGFLAYYQIKKLPQFLLASPVFIALCGCLRHFVIRLSSDLMQVTNFKKRSAIQQALIKSSESLLTPLVAQLAILTLSGGLFANVEITTRLAFSSSPLLYWYLASVICDGINRRSKSTKIQWQKVPVDSSCLSLFRVSRHIWKLSDIRGRLILSWCFLYLLIGTMLHTNFWPWT